MRLFKSTALVSAMTLISRILGLVRDLVFARMFGVSAATDAFFVAFRIPNFLRRLFAEGSFSLAFVPVLAEIKAKNDAVALRDFVAHVGGTLAGILLVVAGLGCLASPALVALFAPGFVDDPAKFSLTADLLRITFPYILLISLAGFAGGILNSYRQFLLPSISPVLLNLAMIGAALYGAPYFAEPITALAWGVIIGGVLQLLLQVPGLIKLKLLPRPRWGWRDSGVRRVLTLMIPTLFGSSVAQINLLIDTLIASMLISGSVTWLYYTDRLLEFPLGIFGVALGTVILPHLSSKHAENDPQAFSHSVDWGLRVGLFISIPAMLLLIALAAPMFWTLFGYGRFSERDVAMSALSLSMLALGLPAFIAVKVLAPAFYARQDTRTPVKAGIASMVSNMLLNAVIVYAWIRSGHDGPHAGLALSSALAGYLNAGLLYYWLIRSGCYAPGKGWRRWIAALVAGGIAMLIALYYLAEQLPSFGREDAMTRALLLTLLIGAGSAAFLATVALCGVRPRHLVGQSEK